MLSKFGLCAGLTTKDRPSPSNIVEHEMGLKEVMYIFMDTGGMATMYGCCFRYLVAMMLTNMRENQKKE